MSEQLDWLARNVHEWPVELQGKQEWCWVITHINEGYRWTGNRVLFSRPSDVKITRQQWLDRRAELQGNPSWKDAPEWATHLGQNARGQWYFMKNASQAHKSSARYYHNEHSGVTVSQGEILGDWRDTLERRPGSLGVSASEASAAVGDALRSLSRADALRWAVENVKTWPTWESGEQAAPAGWNWVQLSGAMYLGVRTNVPAISEEHWARVLFKNGIEEFTSLEDAQPVGEDKHTPEQLSTAVTHTIHHAAFLHHDCQLLLNEPELVVFRTADGELLHCKPKECLIDPDQYGLAARLLSDMSGCNVAPEHIRELVEQMGWAV